MARLQVSVNPEYGASQRHFWENGSWGARWSVPHVAK